MAAELVVILRDDEVVIVKQRHQPCLSLVVLTLLVLAERASTVGGRRPTVFVGHKGFPDLFPVQIEPFVS